MGIRSFFAENKKARQEHRENNPSWWHRKKHHDFNGHPRSWYEDMVEVDEIEAKEHFPSTVDSSKFQGATPSSERFDEIRDDFWDRSIPALSDTSRYDTVPSYEIPAAMIALKGAPTNNVGLYLKWRDKKNG